MDKVNLAESLPECTVYFVLNGNKQKIMMTQIKILSIDWFKLLLLFIIDGHNKNKFSVMHIVVPVNEFG